MRFSDMRSFIILCSLSVLSIYPLPAKSAYEEGIRTNKPHTLIDPSGRISFAFNGKYALKIAKKVNIPDGTPLSNIPVKDRCTSANEGVIRYNKATKSIEFCNGSSIDQTWQSTQKREATPVIDYSQCQYSVKTGNSGLSKFGATGVVNMDAACNRIDRVMVATDTGGGSNPYNKFYCCKVKLVYK